MNKLGMTFVHLPDRVKCKVGDFCSSSYSLIFTSNSPSISKLADRTNYQGVDSMSNMGAQGIDLFAFDENSVVHMCSTSYLFGGSRLAFNFNNLNTSNFEYRAVFSNNDEITGIKVGCNEESSFKLLETLPDHPIVVYSGTTVQGENIAMSWTY
ncbi:hypothetical protein TRFO_40368 [Tritrichomonas foetus]|uniref:SGNH hydrolase-type esterase N-terminal domain-containing protein n=1 Tax=Tritrichomonas foetus TaxID=1144522 RepID=A0A1J4J3N4_9EUKA|nr:hypothetical protein TRFO_40368 [Tritrichomonas foetus]|eukprot:OHS93353.1 hypothetical protein TRFO_40368 [Tritrichomonas foetus]